MELVVDRCVVRSILGGGGGGARMRRAWDRDWPGLVYCVAYTKSKATLWHEQIYLFVNESLSRGLVSYGAAISHTDFGCKPTLFKT